jgi:PhzF family phenazine biosynthesis protein
MEDRIGMNLFIVDAFTNERFGGNQAGVVLLPYEDGFPSEWVMQKIASELKHSETAYVRTGKSETYEIRYFTPEGEVPLCGHATLSAFTVLREERNIDCGAYRAVTTAGELSITVEPERIWIRMPRGETVRQLSEEESNRAYAAFGLTPEDQPNGMIPAIVKVGLADVLLPVSGRDRLNRAVQNRGAVIALSKDLQVVGVHLYCRPSNGNPAAYCRNFAPLYGIDEESATGTSNASPTHDLNQNGLILSGAVNTFIQGETMGKPSVIRSRVDGEGIVSIGGSAVISVRGVIQI